MRICMVHNSYGSVSGEEMVVDTTTTLLRNNGHEVISFQRSSEEIPEMRFGRIRAFFNGMYSRSSSKSMRRTLAEFNPDVVHVHNLYPLISPSVLQVCREMGFPVVMTTHNYRLVCPNGLLMHQGRICEKCSQGREWWCFLQNCEKDRFKSLGYAMRNYIARSRDYYRKNVTEFVALTEFQRQYLIREGYPEECIHVIPNTINQTTVHASDTLGNCVGYVGRISPEKDIPSLMEAARLHRDIPFKAAGAYDRLPLIPEAAPDNFEFLGMLEKGELTEFYQNSRIIVLCSTCYEGFPSVLAEAMSYGKPVVCSRIGGLPEIVEDGATGLLFEPGNAADLAAKIRYLWDRPDLCRRMGQAGQEKARREYTQDTYYQRLLAVYEKAVEFGPQQSCNYKHNDSYRNATSHARDLNRNPMQKNRTGYKNYSERILGIPVSLLSLNAITDKTVRALDAAGPPFTVAFANPHSLVVSRRDEEFRRALESASVVAPDGTGIVLASLLHRGSIRKRITGFDFFDELSRILNERGGSRYFFLGSSQKTLDRLRSRFEKLYPSITFAGSYSPPYREKFSSEETANMVASVNAAKADVLWISLTAPKQEKWVHLNAASLNVKVIGAIGAVFDYFAGNIRRPGKVWRACGLEWFPRLLQEPKRLWRRNFISSLQFIYLTVLDRDHRQAGYQQSFAELEKDLPESPFTLLGRTEEETALQQRNDSMDRDARKEPQSTEDYF